ncbi:MAG: response regulator [Gammaproteobacteria bacterium]|nr:response regulator [Gammaproteobacteria bacterium]
MVDSVPVLVIDGDPAVRDSVETLATTTNAAVRSFSSAAAFFDSKDAGNATVVVCADQLPDANGLEVFQQLKDDGFEGAFALLLNRADAHLARHARRIGVTNVLRKPLITMELMRFLGASTRQWTRNE